MAETAIPEMKGRAGWQVTLRRWCGEPRAVVAAYTLLTVGASLHQYAKVSHDQGGVVRTSINNFVIFRQSFFHLLAGSDLYRAYPLEHWDVFKYSPTFALAFAPFSLLPTLPGLVAWDLLNALSLLAAILSLPTLPLRSRVGVAWFAILELLTSLQNSQSNGLVAACMILGFAALARGRPLSGAFAIVASVFTKLFGGVALLFALLFPRGRQAVAAAVGWTLLLALVPLLVVSPHQLVATYASWLELLRNDHSVGFGLSVTGVLYSWFGWQAPSRAVLAVGGLLLGLPLARRECVGHPRFATLFLASTLLWVVIFNHMAESPTFVIAVCGVALWYFSQPRPTVASRTLLILTFVLTSLSPTDLFPRGLRDHLVYPYTLKAVPCIVVWLVVECRLLFGSWPGQGTETTDAARPVAPAA